MLTLNDGRTELWQWDTGRKLSVDADCSQVHFSNKVFGRSVDVDVVDGVAIVPDILLQTDKELTAWAFVGTAENGYTKISKVFKVNKRNKPADYVFTPQDQSTLGEILDRIEDLENRPSGDVSKEDIQNAVNDYLDKNPVSFEEKDPTVPEWAKKPQKPTYTAGEVGAQPKGDYALRSELPKVPQTLPNPHKLTFTGAVTAEYDGSNAVTVEIPQGGTGGAKKWDLLGEYTFAEDAPVAAITLTELPNYTEFMVYFEGTCTTAATGDISFFINDVRVCGFSSIDSLYSRAHLYIQDRWHCDCTERRTAKALAVTVFSDNYRAVDLTDAAVSLRIQNQYGASSFKNGTVVIYGGK